MIKLCKVLVSGVLLSFLHLAGWEKQNIVGTTSGLRVRLFGPKPSKMLDTKPCSVNDGYIHISWMGGSFNCQLIISHYQGYGTNKYRIKKILTCFNKVDLFNGKR